MLMTLLFIISFLATVRLEPELDYYWLDYKGGPAPKAYIFKRNNPVYYVGQVYDSTHEVLPAYVQKTSPIATSYGKQERFTTDENVKILCSQFSNRFHWVEASSVSYRSIPNLVEGGTQNGTTVYIGKIILDNKPILGIVKNEMVYVHNGVMYETTGPFLVLAYNPIINKVAKMVC